VSLCGWINRARCLVNRAPTTPPPPGRIRGGGREERRSASACMHCLACASFPATAPTRMASGEPKRARSCQKPTFALPWPPPCCLPPVTSACCQSGGKKSFFNVFLSQATKTRFFLEYSNGQSASSAVPSAAWGGAPHLGPSASYGAPCPPPAAAPPPGHWAEAEACLGAGGWGRALSLPGGGGRLNTTPELGGGS
jgi:hypothetical protein